MSRSQSLTEDTAYTLLSDPRRRHLLAVLNENGATELDELATRIAAREATTLDEETRRHVLVSLVHNHLPRLEDHDVVHHDPNRGTVELLDVFEELRPYLDELATRESILQRLIS